MVNILRSHDIVIIHRFDVKDAVALNARLYVW